VIDGKTETDRRIFVLSRKLSPKALLETAPDHWQIENPCPLTRHYRTCARSPGA
jgi:hypothetical protein